MFKKFQPQNLGVCTCSWCKDKVDKSLLTVHVSQYDTHLFKKPTPIDWFQLCPHCEMALCTLAIKIAREN